MDNLLEHAESAKDAVDIAVTSVATKAMGGGATTTAMGWLLSNEGIVAIGLLLTILGFVVNLIFQIRRDLREHAMHRAQLAALIKVTKDSVVKEMLTKEP